MPDGVSQAAARARAQHAVALALALAAALAAVATTGTLGCGSSTPAAVATVQGTAISEPALRHWEAIKRREAQAGSGAGAAPSARALQDRALAFLITAQWLEQEASARGIEQARSADAASYTQLLDGPGGQRFAEILAARGLSHEDELFLLHLEALAEKLKASVAGTSAGATPAQRAARLSAFEAAFRARWRQRTSCRRAFVIAQCGRTSGA